MTRAEILSQFTVDERGTIRDPGKFEGEPVYVPAFYDAYMNGCPDDDIDGVLYFDVTPEDVAEFPELQGVGTVTLYVGDDGFVNSATHEEAGFRADSEEEEEAE
jgi:hypothetical protein